MIARKLETRIVKLEVRRRRLQRTRPLKVVTVRRSREEDQDAALDRHFAAHPEDRGANIVIFHFLR